MVGLSWGYRIAESSSACNTAHILAYPSYVIGNTKFFVWRVDLVVRKPETWEDRWYSESLLEKIDDRDGATAADICRWTAKNTLHRLGCFRQERIFGIDQAGWRCVHEIESRGNPSGADGSNGGGYLGGHFLWFLGRNEAEADFRRGGGGNYGLRAFPSITATDAVNFQGRAGPDTELVRRNPDSPVSAGEPTSWLRNSSGSKGRRAPSVDSRRRRARAHDRRNPGMRIFPSRDLRDAMIWATASTAFGATPP